jgi:hypothetical protein
MKLTTRLVALLDDAIAFQEVINGSAHAIVSGEPKPTFFLIEKSGSIV